MGNQPCLARQGAHTGAEPYFATRLLTLDNQDLIKWQDRKIPEWLDTKQVEDAPYGMRESKTKMPKEAAILQLNQIFNLLRPVRYGDEIHTFRSRISTLMPFSDLPSFLDIVNNCNDDKIICKTRKCGNKRRRKGGLCNRCYELINK